MRLNEDSYRKKVRAGWLGKCIGGNLGAIPECLKKRSYFLKPEDFMPEKTFLIGICAVMLIQKCRNDCFVIM